MAFGLFETSRSRGAPVELFRFKYGPLVNEAFCYTNGEREYVHEGLTYKPIPIKRSKLSASTEDKSRAALELNMPGDTDLADLFRASAPSGFITLTLFQGHSRDPDEEFLAIWTGSVTTCGWRDDGNTARVVCEPTYARLRRLSLRRHYQYMCPFVLYGDQCRASEAAATTEASIMSVQGRFVTLDRLVPNATLLVGGFLKFTDLILNVHARTIQRHEIIDGRSRLMLTAVDKALHPGLVVKVLRGCTHDIPGCKTHNNVLNFGGQPYIPTKSPLGSYGVFS